MRAGVRDGTTFRLTIGLGEVTVISGSCVEDGGGAASCDIALPPIPHSSSQLALLMWKARLTKNAMDQILIEAAAIFVIVNEFGSACRRYATDRFLFIPRGGSATHHVATPRGGHQTIDVRRWGEREAERRREPNS